MVLYFYFCLNLLIVGCLCEKDEDLKAVGDTKATKANVDLNNVVFVVVTQTSKHHTSIANVTVNTLKKNLIENGVRDPKVCDTQKDFPVKGGWTFFPIFPALYDKFSDSSWFVFLDETCNVNVEYLKKVLSKYDSQVEDFFLGYVITDNGNTIIHSFSKGGLKYPDLKAGFILSKNLVRLLADEVKGRRDCIDSYSVDAKYELAKILAIISAVKLTHEPQLCPTFRPDCAIYPRTIDCSNQTSKELLLDKTLFVVKTCRQYHRSRLPIVLETWGKLAKHIVYASDLEEPIFGTSVLAGAEENTSSGHCRKTQAILKYFKNNSEKNDWHWLVVTDDDTLLSVPKLMDLISCYDENESIALGERYGYWVSGIRGRLGYDYLAGGSGMIFSHKTVETMMSQSHIHCRCKDSNTHDDLHIGACLNNLKIPVVNTNRLHQARPGDYNTTLLERQDPISFHKFDVENPLETYQKWFKAEDEKWMTEMANKAQLCSEP